MINQIFDSLQIPDVSNFFFFWFENGAGKNTHIFQILKGRYFVMGSPIYRNVSVFWEISVGFLKNVVLQIFPK